LLDNFPGYWNWLRYMLCAPLFRSHDLLTQDSAWQADGGEFNPANDELRRNLTAYIVEQTCDDPSLTEKLIPDYAPFSRRLVVDNGWYRALTSPHVDLVTDEIVRVTPRGIVTDDGEERDVDVIITAVGFEVTRYLWPADYIGRDGTTIQDAWRNDGPRAYIGLMIPDFPTMFTIYGPNSQPLSGGTGMPMWYVTWAEYATRCIIRLLEEGKSTVEVTRAAFERYNAELDTTAQELLLLDEKGAPDKNYYVDRGRLQTNAPWYGPEYHRMCTDIEWDDLAFDAS
jgi:4-hydroxyacetophenone monooxygenase